MSQPPKRNPSRLAYPLPWSMSPDEQTPESSCSSEDPPDRLRAVKPESTFGRWLREFVDERTGGTSPPPMH